MRRRLGCVLAFHARYIRGKAPVKVSNRLYPISQRTRSTDCLLRSYKLSNMQTLADQALKARTTLQSLDFDSRKSVEKWIDGSVSNSDAAFEYSKAILR